MLKQIQKEIDEKNQRIHDLNLELTSLKTRHEESVTLSERYLEDLRISRDEEIRRFEEDVRILKEEHAQAVLVMQDKHKEEMMAIESAMDSLRTTNRALRQEHESLVSKTKKAELKAREADRETQRALNKLESAITSLEHLEHEYTVLEKDAQESEAIKTERILALEDEMDSMRLKYTEEMDALRRRCSQLVEDFESSSAALKEVEQRYRRSEIAAADSLRSEKMLKAKVDDLENKISGFQSDAATWREEAAKAKGEVQRIRGALDGAENLSKSSKKILESYQNENKELNSHIEELKARLVQLDGEISQSKNNEQHSQQVCEELRARIGKLESAMSLQKDHHQTAIESMQKEHEGEKLLWDTERESLHRELELLRAKVESFALLRHRSSTTALQEATTNHLSPQSEYVTTFSQRVSEPNGSNTDSAKQVEEKKASSDGQRTACGSTGDQNDDDGGSISFNMTNRDKHHEITPQNMSHYDENQTPVLHDTPADLDKRTRTRSDTEFHSTKSSHSNDRSHLRQQLAALKLSLLDMTPAQSTLHFSGNSNQISTKIREDSQFNEKDQADVSNTFHSMTAPGQLQSEDDQADSIEPGAENSRDSLYSDSLSGIDDDHSDMGALSKARYQVEMAKQYLQQVSDLHSFTST